jgi:hypothetical protein
VCKINLKNYYCGGRFSTSIPFPHTSYKLWMTTERSTLITTVQSCIDSPQSSAEKLNILLYHSFNGQQSTYFHVELKMKFTTGGMACDFSENYSIIETASVV